MAESSDFAKKAKKYILLVDPVWCTVNAKILLFLVDKSVNIHDFSANYIRTTKICLISVPVTFPVPRRGIIKSCKEISRNYGSSGPFLDTIIYNFLLSETERT